MSCNGVDWLLRDSHRDEPILLLLALSSRSDGVLVRLSMTKSVLRSLNNRLYLIALPAIVAESSFGDFPVGEVVVVEGSGKFCPKFLIFTNTGCFKFLALCIEERSWLKEKQNMYMAICVTPALVVLVLVTYIDCLVYFNTRMLMLLIPVRKPFDSNYFSCSTKPSNSGLL